MTSASLTFINIVLSIRPTLDGHTGVEIDVLLILRVSLFTLSFRRQLHPGEWQIK